jgi:exonuclease III
VADVKNILFNSTLNVPDKYKSNDDVINDEIKAYEDIHWNANSLNNKMQEFNSFILQKEEPDIVSINETKMSDFRANTILNFNNYNVIHKARYENKNGAGGVAILINKRLSYRVIKDVLFDDIECVAINIFIKNTELTFLSYYNPPQCHLNIESLTEIQKKYEKLIICGDLNAKSANLGCNNDNNNGILLQELLLNTNLLVANNNECTYHRMNDNSQDILDWCLISNNIHDKLKSF